MPCIMIISDNLSCESCDDYFFVYFLQARVCWPLPCLLYVAHFVFLSDVWIRTQRAALASMRATNLATHPPNDTYLSSTVNHIHKHAIPRNINNLIEYDPRDIC
jgi:hypothetical protein